MSACVYYSTGNKSDFQRSYKSNQGKEISTGAFQTRSLLAETCRDDPLNLLSYCHFVIGHTSLATLSTWTPNHSGNSLDCFIRKRRSLGVLSIVLLRPITLFKMPGCYFSTTEDHDATLLKFQRQLKGLDFTAQWKDNVWYGKDYNIRELLETIGLRKLVLMLCFRTNIHVSYHHTWHTCCEILSLHMVFVGGHRRVVTVTIFADKGWKNFTWRPWACEVRMIFHQVLSKELVILFATFLFTPELHCGAVRWGVRDACNKISHCSYTSSGTTCCCNIGCNSSKLFCCCSAFRVGWDASVFPLSSCQKLSSFIWVVEPRVLSYIKLSPVRMFIYDQSRDKKIFGDKKIFDHIRWRYFFQEIPSSIIGCILSEWHTLFQPVVFVWRHNASPPPSLWSLIQ